MNTNITFQILPFSEIKEKFPKESRAYWRNEKHDGEFENETILYIKGDTEIAHIDLDMGSVRIDEHDFSDLPDNNGESIFAVLVDGNLTVSRYIYNGQKDVATGLLVLGNLKTRNAVVGGQEIFVTGNLEVDELFWGECEYTHHGELVVRGDASAAVFIDTEGYHVNITGKQNFGAHFGGTAETPDYQIFQEKILKHYFIPECIKQAYGEQGDNEVSLIIPPNFLRENKSFIIRENIGKPLPPEFPILFPTPEINIHNLLRLAASPLMQPTDDKKDVCKFSFQIEDIFFRVVKSLPDILYLNPPYIGVYLEKWREYAALIEAKKTDDATYAVTTKVRRVAEELPEEQKQWYWYDEDITPENFKLLLHYGWQQLLVSVSQYEFYRKQISPLDIEQMLALPVVQPYDNYYDTDKHGFWRGNIWIGFRQEGALFENRPQVAMLKIARYRTTPENEQAIEFYLYFLEKDIYGNKSVAVSYNPDQDKGTSVPVPFHDTERLKTARRLFLQAQKKLLVMNGQLVNEHKPPYNAKDFAIKYWQEKGYIN